MPRPRFHRLAEPERQALLQLAAEEFARHGFFGASYNRVIEQSPLGKSSVYLAFDDKEDLFFTVLQHRLAAVDGPRLERLDALRGEDDFWSAAEAWIRGFGQQAVEDPLIIPLAKSFYALLPTSERARALEREVLTVFARFVARGQALDVVRGDLRSEELAVLALGSLMALDELAIADVMSASDEVSPSRRLRRWTTLAVDLLRRVLSPAPTHLEDP